MRCTLELQLYNVYKVSNYFDSWHMHVLKLFIAAAILIASDRSASHERSIFILRTSSVSWTSDLVGQHQTTVTSSKAVPWIPFSSLIRPRTVARRYKSRPGSVEPKPYRKQFSPRASALRPKTQGVQNMALRVVVTSMHTASDKGCVQLFPTVTAVILLRKSKPKIGNINIRSLYMHTCHRRPSQHEMWTWRHACLCFCPQFIACS